MTGRSTAGSYTCGQPDHINLSFSEADMTDNTLPGAVRPVNEAPRAHASLPTILAPGVADPHHPGKASSVAADGATGPQGAPDLSLMLPTAALAVLRTLVPNEPCLPVKLYERILSKALEAIRQVYDVDALFLPAQSRLTSVTASMQRREGDFLQRGFLAGIDLSPHLILVESEGVMVTRTVMDHVRRLGHEACSDVDLTPQGPVEHWVLPDVMMLDLRHSKAVGVELKRGAQLGAKHNERLADDVAATSLVLQHHLGERGFKVASAEARVIVFRQDARLRVPGGLMMTLPEFDERFGTDTAAIVAAVRRVHAKAAMILLRPLQAAALAEADAMLGICFGTAH